MEQPFAVLPLDLLADRIKIDAVRQPNSIHCVFIAFIVFVAFAVDALRRCAAG